MDNFIEYGWEDEIVNEGGDFVLLPEGDYDFTVAKYERARHEGSAKVPPCNMAKVTFTIWGAEDSVEITENFFLCNKFEWKLSALFLALGLKKHGEPLKMNSQAKRASVTSTLTTTRTRTARTGSPTRLKSSMPMTRM